METVIIEVLGALLGIAAAMIFYETLWVAKKINWYAIAGGILIIAAVNVALTSLLLNTAVLPAISIILMLALSFFFTSNIKIKILFSFAIVAIMFSSELLVGIIFLNVLNITIEQVQGSSFLYFLGIVTSKMFALFFVYIIRIVMKGYKKETGIQFNLIMALMPMQSIIICFVIYFYTINADASQASQWGLGAILISLAVIFTTFFIIKDLQKAIAYKRKYELAELKLIKQIEHYEKLYYAQNDIRTVRHDLNNTLTAIYGLLEGDSIQEAKDRIKRIATNLKKSASVTDTGIPAMDAVIDAKIDRASGFGITIVRKIAIDHELLIDGFDLAGIVANALDNAIEGVLRSNDIENEILLNISCMSGFVSIIVENCADGPVDNNFQSSKSDKENHGFGIAQMKAITKKYSGDFRPLYDREKRKFSLKVLLENKIV